MEFLTLQRVVEGFNAPINEEQAWAVCYQCGKILQSQRESSSSCRKLSGLRSVKIYKDGNVESVDTAEGSEDSITSSESELVQSLGLVVYQALDYGLGENEEHTLTPALETLISHMTGSDTDTEPEGEVDGDEGIEHDEPSSSHMSLDAVLQICTDHAGSGQEAATHYKAVCRALHAEAQELLTFLVKIAEKKRLQTIEADEEERKRLEELKRADWARLWLQVMRQLRHGIKLKKVEQVELTPAEFELTPYEMLMEDIRSHRYSLNKIMVNGNIPPQTKKDAHSVILEFIRSRPPLHPAKDRVLRSAPLETPDVREKLLREIKSEPRLKPIPGNLTADKRLDELKSSPVPSRKVIKPDVSLFIDNSSEEEITDDEDVFDDKNKVEACPLSPLSPLSPPPLDATSKSPWTQSVDLDLESQEASFRPERRHSITVCESPERPQGSKTTMQVNGKSPSGSSTRSTISGSFSPRPLKPSLECLSLTIEEVMHIRNVLTKAELESLLVDPELHELVSKGKICFRCKENKFSLFGHWSTKCKFCSRHVCSKCFSKMRIPTEHFEHIPVYTLSPSPLSPGSDKFDFLFPFELSGSAPTSPADDDHLAPPPPPQRHPSIPDNANNNRSRPLLQRSKTTTKAPPARAIEGPLMNVCKDCKAMVVNIIKASRFSLAGAGPSRGRFIECPQRKALRNFHLDLKPVYK